MGGMKQLERRVQLLLDDARYDKVAREAEQRGMSVGAVVREAIDQFDTLADRQRRREAIDAILSAPPMPVPDDPEDLKREIEEMHSSRFPDV